MGTSSITVSSLTVIDDVKGIKLAWIVTDPWPKETHYSLDAVEVWASATNDRTTAAKVGEGISDFSHAGLGRGDVRYYWTRARDKLGDYGPWHPTSTTAGVEGTEVSGDVLLSTNGYWIHPSGLIEQWGQKTLIGASGGRTVTFPIAFPSQCLQVIASPFVAVGSSSLTYTVSVLDFDATSAELYGNLINAGVVSAPDGIIAVWRALGY